MTKRPNPPDGNAPTTDSVVTALPTAPTTTVGSVASSGSHAMRRGGARREVTERVLVKDPSTGKELEGWALNLSRGGLRAILEEKVEFGAEYLVTLGEGDDVAARRARVVWVQEEPDGVIVGVEFVGLSGIHLPPTVPPAEIAADKSTEKPDKKG